MRVMESGLNDETMLSPSEYKNFRLYLQAELLKRCEKNPRYSLRAFARSLDIHHSSLSRILRGHRSLTKKKFLQIVNSLNLGPSEIEKFTQHKSSRAPHNEFKDLPLDVFIVISEWYHDAILELTRLKNFQPHPGWISRILGITVNEANIAIERLVRLELIEVRTDGRWVNHAEQTEIGIETPYTSGALKKYQKRILQMAIESVDDISKERRHNISSTVALDSKDLDVVKKKLNEFRRAITKFIQRKNVKADEVYQLGICFYPLTNRKGSTL